MQTMALGRLVAAVGWVLWSQIHQPVMPDAGWHGNMLRDVVNKAAGGPGPFSGWLVEKATDMGGLFISLIKRGSSGG